MYDSEVKKSLAICQVMGLLDVVPSQTLGSVAYNYKNIGRWWVYSRNNFIINSN